MTINYSSLEKINIALESHENTELLIVSKKQSITDINNLIDNGYKLFGENRVQEAEEKYTNILDKKDIYLHLIGPLQSNKVKNALKIFHTIQSIDRVKLVKEIQKYKDHLSLTKNFFIQVNIGMEEQKNGISPNDTESFYNFCLDSDFPIEGLMCIPPNNENPKIFFKQLLDLRNKINKNLKLSMGMSGDYEVALEFNTNIIRIGSKIFL